MQHYFFHCSALKVAFEDSLPRRSTRLLAARLELGCFLTRAALNYAAGLSAPSGLTATARRRLSIESASV
uniref:Uncharacterized protein n=1 Tax=Steinernema glaseri TaxID=37863 RepID=A0A1I7YDZ8_9BILA